MKAGVRLLLRRKAILPFLQVSWEKNSEDNPVASANLEHQTQLVMKLEIIGPLFPQHLWFPPRRAQRTFIRSTKSIWEHEFLWTCKSFMHFTQAVLLTYFQNVSWEKKNKNQTSGPLHSSLCTRHHRHLEVVGNRLPLLDK